MSPFIPERIFKPVCDSRLNRICLKTKHPARPRSFAALCQLLTPSCSKKSLANILSCPQTERRSSPVSLPSVLCWHLKGWCGPEHPSVMPLGLRCPLSLSFCLSLSHFLFLWPGWVSIIMSVELCQGKRKWIMSRVWAWLCWPWLRGVSRSSAGLADIILQIWAKRANI